MARRSLKGEESSEAEAVDDGAKPRAAEPVLEWWPASKLVGNPLNWRSHSAKQRAALDGVMDKVGWAGAVIVNRRTGHVIDGHLRMERALERSGELVPVLVFDLPEDKEHLALATHDTLARWAEGDQPGYEQLRGEVAAGFDDLGDEVSGVMREVAAELAGDAAKRARAAKHDVEGWWVKVECGSEAEQRKVYERMQGQGRACRVLTL